MSGRLRWAPIVPGQAATTPVELIKDPVVRKAVESLSGLMNKSNALLTSPYEDWAKDVLRILRTKGHSTEPKDIKSWQSGTGGHPVRRMIWPSSLKRFSPRRPNPRSEASPMPKSVTNGGANSSCGGAGGGKGGGQGRHFAPVFHTDAFLEAMRTALSTGSPQFVHRKLGRWGCARFKL